MNNSQIMQFICDSFTKYLIKWKSNTDIQLAWMNYNKNNNSWFVF